MHNFRKILFILLLAALAPLAAKANQNARGWCEDGAQPVVTSGLTSTTLVQASYPACTVTVFVHGGGLAQIFSDNNNTPLGNPFTAQNNGQWLFYAANGRYDVQLSGAGFPTPVTYSDVVLTDSQVNNLALLPNTNLVFSPTPSFDTSQNAAYTMILTGNVTSSLASGSPSNGNLLALNICEDGTGGWTFTFPTNFIIPPSFVFIGTPGTCNYLPFKYDGTSWTFLVTPGGGSGGSTAPGPPANALQFNNSNTFGGSNFLNLTNNSDWTTNPGTLITNANSPGAIALTDPNNVNQVAMVVDNQNSDSTYLFVQAMTNNPSPTAPEGGETIPFGSWAWIGGPQNTLSGSGGGCFFYPPSNPPNCAISSFFIAGDVGTDTNSGQDLVAVYAQLQLTKATGNIHKGVGFFIAPPGNCFLAGTGSCSFTGIPTETAGTMYGVEISDLRGRTTIDQAALKIDAQTAPGAGTGFAIEAAPGSGMNLLNDGITLGAISAPLGSTGKTVIYMDSLTNWLTIKPNGNTPYLVAGITGTVTPNSPLCTTGTGGAVTNVGCGPFGGSNYQTVQANSVSAAPAPTLNLAQGSNMTISCNTAASVTTCTLTSSSTGATAWSAITASTNANAGTFAATGNTWNFSGATAFTVPTAGLIFPGNPSGTMTVIPQAGALGALTVTIPPATDTLVNTSSTQTLINKSIAATEVNSGTLACAQLPAMTGDVTSSAGSCARTVVAVNGGTVPLSATLLGTNASRQPIAAALTSANIYVGSAGNLPVGVAPTGDWTITNAGVNTVAKVNSVAYPAAPATNTVPVVTGANQITYEQVPNAALLNGGTTTVNGQACALGSTCNVNPGLSVHTVATNQGNGVALSGVGPGTLGQAFISQGNAEPIYGTLQPVGGGTGAVSPAAHAVALSEGTSPFNFVVPGAAGTCLTSNGAAADPTFQTCASGGGGSNPMTLIGQMIGGGAAGVQTAIAAGLTGQSIVAINNAVPSFASPGLGGNNVTSTPYAVACDTATSIVDRTLLKTFKSGASVVNVPDPTTAGCGGNFYFAVLDDGAGTLTFNRGTTAVFNIATGSANIDNATSFQLTNGQYAILNSPDNANWTVRIYSAAGVNTFSGDGVLLSNVTSSGAVTATLGTAGAHQFFGNNTGAPATPGYFQPAFTDFSGFLQCAQFPALTGDTTTSAGSCATTTSRLNGTAFAGTNGNVVRFGAANTPSDSGILSTNLLTAAANITTGNLVQGSGSKTTSDSNIAALNVVTATANFVSANLIQGAGANKTTSDSGIATANVVTATANLTNTLLTYGNGSKGIAGGATSPIITSALNCTGAGTGTAQTCSTTPTFVPAINSLLIATVSTPNTGDLTLNANASVAAHVRKWLSTATLVANDFPSGVPVLLLYDGTFWNMMTIGNAPAGGGSGVLSAITAAVAANTIGNGNNPQTWNFAQITNNQTAFTFGETSAATAGTLNGVLANQVELAASTATASTATPFSVTQGTVTGATAFPAMQIATSWNNAGLVGQGLVLSVTNTSSAAGSKIFNTFVGGLSVFSIDVLGGTVVGNLMRVGGPITAPSGSANLTFQGGLDGGVAGSAQGTGTFKSGDNTSTTASSAGGSTIVRGGNETGATANTTLGGGLSLFGGNTLSSGIASTGGGVSITGGACVNVVSATNCAGAVKVVNPYFTTGTANVGDLACVTGANTVASCSGTGNGGFIGVIDSVSGSNVFVSSLGIGGARTFNSASIPFVTGHSVCQSTAGGAANLVIDNGILSCPAGQTVGIYIGTSQTTTTPLVWMAPTSGGSTVSSITGDGALFSNTNSTGAVILSLGPAGGHKYWGNNTSTSATPAYFQPAFTDMSGSIACSQLPALTGDTTTPAGSCATTNARINGVAFPTSAVVVGSNASAQPIGATTTGTGTTVVLATNPVLVTPNLGTPSTLVLTNATLLPCSAKPAELGDVTSPAGSCTNTLATVNANVGAFTNANITVNAKGLITAASNGSGTGGGIAQWPINLPVAVCQGAGPSLGGSGASATLPIPVCINGSTTQPQSGAQIYAQATLGTLYVDYSIILPSFYTGFQSVTFKVQNDTATTGTDYMNFQYACVADGSNDTPTYAAVQQASGAVPGTINTNVTLTLSAPTITGCAGGNAMYVRVGAGTGAGVFASGNLRLTQIRLEMH